VATYYVDFVNGLDANNGLGPDASAGTNKPWKTIAKLLGASGMASGDTAYLSPAGPFREIVTVAMTSAVAETKILGDPANAQGFKTSGGVLVAAGDVIWTTFTTNDTTAPSASALLTLAGRDFLTFQYIVMVGGTGSSIDGSTTQSVNIKLVDCVFKGGHGSNTLCIQYIGLADVASNWTFQRCTFFASPNSRFFDIILPTSSVADYDANFVIDSCRFVGTSGFVRVSSSGALSFKGGGVYIWNCTLIGGNQTIQTSSAALSTTIPVKVYNCLIISMNTALNANASGQIVEDFNNIWAATARTNVSIGGSSKTNTYALLVEVGEAWIMGRLPRHFLEPNAGSPLLGFGNQAGAPSAVDLLNRPRPAGGGSASVGIGALERHDTAAKETTIVDAGGVGLNLVSPGDHDLLIPVGAVATNITIKYRSDASVVPTAQVMGNSEIGVSDSAVQTGSAGQGTFTVLTIPTFTPSRAGWVRLRLACTGGVGSKAYFDTVTGGADGTQGLDYFNRGEPFPAAVESAAGGGGGILEAASLNGGMI
jgi:hypothetical protein